MPLESWGETQEREIQESLRRERRRARITNRSLPKTPGAGKVEAAGIEPARDSLPKLANSRQFCYPQCRDPWFNECADCWHDAQEAS